MPEHHHQTERALPAIVLACSTAVAAAVLEYERHKGMMDIDDAYITFRYAENISRGWGFVYNSGEHVLGTTTPLFCLVLAFLRTLGVDLIFAADLLSLVSYGLSAMFVYMIGREARGRSFALMAAFLFAFFPNFWLNLGTGMETMFTTFLCLSVVWLDREERYLWAGVAGAFLLLARVDALALVAAVLLLRFLKSPKNALMAALALVLTLAPWVIFTAIYFGSPVPHSVLAKKLIHILMPSKVLFGFANWFIGRETAGREAEWVYPPMLAFSAFALAGAVRAFEKERWAAVFALWIVFYVAGLALGQASPFFWYKVPMLSGYLILVALGIDWLLGAVLKSSTVLRATRVAVLVLLAGSLIFYYAGRQVGAFTLKEAANLKLAQVIEKEAKPGAKILAAEIGVVGYELKDDYIIDSAGLVSDEVYQIRRADKKELMKTAPAYKYDWWGTPEWVSKVIARYSPEYIVSDLRYLHLKTLLNESEFQARYLPVATETTPNETIVLLKRQGPAARK